MGYVSNPSGIKKETVKGRLRCGEMFEICHSRVSRYLRFVIRRSIDAPHDTEPDTAFRDLSCAANQLNLALLYSMLTFTVVSNPSFPFQTSISYRWILCCSHFPAVDPAQAVRKVHILLAKSYSSTSN